MVKQDIKSVLNPSAQSTKLCGVEYEKYVSIDASRFVNGREFNLSQNDRLLIEIMSVSGCRVSEVLSVGWQQLGFDGSIYILGLKGSYSKIVKVTYMREYVIQLRTRKINPFMGLSRFYVYRLFKKIGISVKTVPGGKMKVTHAFRHDNAKSQELSGFDIDTTARFLGHKKVESTKHYRNEN